jgi:hypothetical protein
MMRVSPAQMRALKIFIALIGLVGMHLILNDFGYGRIKNDILNLGFGFIPVVLCFLFPYSFLALSWWVLFSKSRGRASFGFLFLVSLVASAWNNLGPVSKSLGEPTRVLLLSDRIPVKQAVRNMMIFNLTQAMGTMTTFGLGAALAPLVFSLSETAFWVTIASAIVALGANTLAVYWIVHERNRRRQPSRGRRLRAALHWLSWTSHQLRKYARVHPVRYCASVGLTSCARLSEALVFFAIFSALGSPISLLDSVAVDIGRGISDNVFFFVPYQLGTRELSLLFVTDSVLMGRGSDVAVAASIVFRLGEISWIFFGFLIGLYMIKRRSA